MNKVRNASVAMFANVMEMSHYVHVVFVDDVGLMNLM